MKHIFCIAQCLLLTLLSPLCAAENQPSCEARSKQVKESERVRFLTDCVAQTNTPAHVSNITAQEKHATCEQNSKNLKLEGGRKSEYINTCINKNDTAVEAKKFGIQEHTVASKQHAAPTKVAAVSPQPAAKKTPAPTRSKKSCAKQAKRENLKGDARKKFIRDCSKA